MAVPPDFRPLVGTSDWTVSLGTTDAVVAAAKRGELMSLHNKEILRRRGQSAQKPVEETRRLPPLSLRGSRPFAVRWIRRSPDSSPCSPRR